MTNEPKRDTKAALDALDVLFKDLEREEERAAQEKKAAILAKPVPVPVMTPTPKPIPPPVAVRVGECDLCGAVIRPEDPFGVFPAPNFGAVDCIVCTRCYLDNAPTEMRG